MSTVVGTESAEALMVTEDRGGVLPFLMVNWCMFEDALMVMAVARGCYWYDGVHAELLVTLYLELRPDTALVE